MSASLRLYLETSYEGADKDLFAAFVRQCLWLCEPSGRFGVVVPETWMLLGSYSDFRYCPATEPSRNSTGLLAETAIETLSQLGRHAFSEADPPSNVTLFCARVAIPDVHHRPLCFRLNTKQNDAGYDGLLRSAILSNEMAARPAQVRFLHIPRTPFVNWASDPILRALTDSQRVSGIAAVHDGMTTSNNDRFVRFTWEVNVTGTKWRRYAKAGNYCKWFGLERYRVRWDHSGALIKAQPKSYVRNERRYFTDGLTYNLMARGALGVRVLQNAAFDPASISIFLHESESASYLLGLLNTHTASYLLRFLAEGTKFNGGYVATYPLPSDFNRKIGLLADECVRLKKRFACRSILEESFEPSLSFGSGSQSLLDEMRDACDLLTLEGLLETLVVESYQFDSAIAEIESDTGTPSGWYPRILDNDGKQVLPDEEECSSELLSEALTLVKTTRLSTAEVAILKTRLKTLFETGTGSEENADDPQEQLEDNAAEETANAGTRLPIPAERFEDEFCQKLSVHPSSIIAILRLGVEKEGWRCLPEERRILRDQITIMVLRLLGHRVPKQIGAGESVPEWADNDGIISLSTIGNERALHERVQKQFNTEGVSGEAISTLMTTTLDSWLAIGFFAHHAKQFKKRPIVWQVQSGSFTLHSAPAIACFIYYHKLDSDLLQKVRKLAEDLRKSRETELRGILSVTVQARSDRQENRRVELEDAVVELQRFEANRCNRSAHEDGRGIFPGFLPMDLSLAAIGHGPVGENRR